MSSKLFTLIIIALAIALAVLGSIMPPNQIQNFMLVTNFFNIMIPILAVGALIKYLSCCAKCCHKKSKD